MFLKNGQITRSRLTDFDVALVQMPMQQWVKGRMKALCLSIALAVACLGCSKDLPEMDPKKFVSPAPGKAYEAPETAKPDTLPAEKVPGIPEELKPSKDKLTLAQLVDVALRINPSTQEAWDRARAAAAGWGAARGSYYPTVSANVGGTGGKLPQTSALGSYRGVYGEVGLSLSYLLLDFGGREATAEGARQALIAANWNHNQSIQDLLRDVPQAYYRYLGNKARVQASEVSLNEALTSLRSTEQRKKAGVSTIADVLQARAKADQVRLNLVADRGSVQVSRGELAKAVGWAANAPFDVTEEPKEVPLDRMEQNTKDLIELAVRDRPDLAAARAAVRQGGAELRKAEADLWPKLIATGNTGWTGLNGRAGGSDIDQNDTNYYGGLALQIPIFEGFSLRNKVREARANVEAARAALRSKEESVIADVWTAYYNVQTAAQQVKTSETLLASSSESYKVSLARYRAGAADIVELLNAQSTLVSARAQKVEARTKLFTSYADLVHAIGAGLPAAPPDNQPESTGNREEMPHGK
ncbi:MAG: TolC family protein [Desulfobacterales bacterium]|nr:TolC family protein [Desulfobacterales bacterium]MBL7102638.1 TolC family protein [Desulfobacteraceae bacterium]